MAKTKEQKIIGIVIPVFNDWSSLSVLIGKLSQQEKLKKFKLHIFVIDDGSPEQPEPQCFSKDLRAPTDIQIVRLSNNVGHQRAIAVGLVVASRFEDLEAVVVMDADGEDKPEDVARLIIAWSEDTNAIVVAQRSERSESLVFKFFYTLYKLSFHLVTGEKIEFGNFCLLPRASLRALTFNTAIWNNLAAAISRSPTPRKLLPVARGTRFAGKSRMNFQSLLLHGLSAMSVYADRVLLRILVGSALVAISVVVAIALVVGVIMGTNWAIPDWTYFLFALFVVILPQALLLSGVALFQLMIFRSVKAFVPATDAPSLIFEVRKISASNRLYALTTPNKKG